MLAFRTALAASVLLCAVSSAIAEDARCGQLRALKAQYAGVKLDAKQQAFKRAATAWYWANCRKEAKR